jgi:hypothetical protein
MAARSLTATFPDLVVACDEGAPPDSREAAPTVEVLAARWRNPAFDLLALDREIAEVLADSPTPLCLRLVDHGDSAPACASTALEVVTRYQRLLEGRNAQSDGPLFDRVLEAHRALHDLSKPLVAADYDHALDTWRWVLRLEPQASRAAQVAALFHDVERLVSESELRVEQHAADYEAFKRAHAAAGARLARVTLEALGDEELAARVEALVAGHERPGADPEGQLLNEADALSFFSLNASGFIAYYGLTHTRRKVAYTLARLGARGFRALGGVRLGAEIAALVDDALSGTAAAAAGAAESAP